MACDTKPVDVCIICSSLFHSSVCNFFTFILIYIFDCQIFLSLFLDPYFFHRNPATKNTLLYFFWNLDALGISLKTSRWRNIWAIDSWVHPTSCHLSHQRSSSAFGWIGVPSRGSRDGLIAFKDSAFGDQSQSSITYHKHINSYFVKM